MAALRLSVCLLSPLNLIATIIGVRLAAWSCFVVSASKERLKGKMTNETVLFCFCSSFLSVWSCHRLRSGCSAWSSLWFRCSSGRRRAVNGLCWTPCLTRVSEFGPRGKNFGLLCHPALRALKMCTSPSLFSRPSYLRHALRLPSIRCRNGLCQQYSR